MIMQKGWLGIDPLNTFWNQYLSFKMYVMYQMENVLLKIQQDRLIFSELFSLNFVLC